MHKILTLLRNADQAVIRHLAILLATVTAFLLGPRLDDGRFIQAVITAAAILNFASYLAVVHGPRPVKHLARIASPVVGILSWGALTHLTGGAGNSPFVAGFWLEILIAAMTFSRAGIAVVTVLGLVALWVQELVRAPAVVPPGLLAQSILTLLMGVVTLAIHRSWRRAHLTLAARFAEQSERLRELGKELEDARVLGMSEQAARLGHGLKNTVHSLRGFLRLIEPKLGDQSGATAAVEGLRTAIDQLEALAADTLLSRSCKVPSPSGNGSSNGRLPAPLLTGPAVEATIEEAATGLSAAHPAVRCVRQVALPEGPLPVSRGTLLEILTNVFQNAAQAMNGIGEVTVEARQRDEEWEVRVIDQGPGIPGEVLGQLFHPGFSTKPDGHGIGLYLTHRLVQDHGGRIRVESTKGRGASVSIVFPIVTAA